MKQKTLTLLFLRRDEMAPRWFTIDQIPYDTMWPDDPYWLPLVLEGKKVSADFQLNKKDDIISHTINTVEKL